LFVVTKIVTFAPKFLKMSTKEKLIKRFMRLPKDFTWDELVRLFGIFGFSVDNKGKTSGSRALFVKDNEAHTVHKPHPSNILKRYVIKQVLDFLVEKGFLENKSVSKDNGKELEKSL
jgi:hypothetical protein